MSVNRRNLIAASLGLGAVAATATKAAATQVNVIAIGDLTGLVPNADVDQTAILQLAIDAAADRQVPLVLPSGTIRVRDLRLRAGTRLIGASRTSILQFAGGDAFVTAEKADGLTIESVVFDGAFQAFNDARGEGLVNIFNSRGITIDDVGIRHSAKGALSLTACSGRVTSSRIDDALDFGIKSLDAKGLDISANAISDCGNNGILVWRSEKGEDGSTVTGNRVYRIRNGAGGSGEYGNGINVYRADSVIVANNRVSDCAYTAIRGNAASNIQIIANSCERLGEVAIYSEFGFEGALIANNIVDTAATGISVTNFNEGGRLAVIQGNLIRNLFRREQEAEDKRGEGIGVEADAVVSGNTVEGAPTVGIQIGWGAYMRDVAVTGNVVRNSKVGITITDAKDAGACLIANNMISKVRDGAIRRMHLGVLSGPDLSRESSNDERVTVTGNVSV